MISKRKVILGELAKDEKKGHWILKAFECKVFNSVLDTILIQLNDRMRTYNGVGEIFAFFSRTSN